MAAGPLQARDAECAQLSGLHVRLRDGIAAKHHADLAAEQVVERGADALVGNVQKVDAAAQAAGIRPARCAWLPTPGDAKAELPRLRFRQREQLANRVRPRCRMHDEHVLAPWRSA
jgi:hypothetical protein